MITSVQQEMVAASVQRGIEGAPIPRFAPGIVMAIDPGNTLCEVIVDGTEEGQFGADVLAPNRFMPGDRVMLMFVKPHGCYIIGRRQGDWDDWHVIGNDGEPAFNGGTGVWNHAAGTVFLGQDGPGQVMFTRRSDRVELRGRAGRVSGANDNIFALPDGYRPANDLLIQAGGNLGAASPIGIDMATGMVSCVAGTNTVVFDGVSFTAATPVSI